MPNAQDREHLKGFVSHVWHWLKDCYTEEGYHGSLAWPFIPIDPELVDDARKAWHDFEHDFPLERLLEPLDSAPDEVLVAHGLYGAQLHYKLKLVKVAARKSRAGDRGWKKRFIELVDNLIDSLNATGLAGGLKELKDALVGSLPGGE